MAAGSAGPAPAGAAPHLVVDISAHGFGHIAVTAPVLDCLTERLPALAVTVRSAAPIAKLREHIHRPFQHVDQAFDLGMAMNDALSVDREASLAYYSRAHADWRRTVDYEAGALRELRPTALLSNNPYLSLAAAARAGIPAAALSCLNWADIFRHYCGDQPGADRIHGQIFEAYASATPFICPVPRMPMASLGNLHEVPPIGRRGRPARFALRALVGAGPETRLALLSLGGFGFDLDVSRWPRLRGWKVLSGMALKGGHPDVIPVDHIGMPFVDIFSSADAVISKLGYGTVAEAGINGVPVLYVPRDGWPEEPHLAQWLARHGRCRLTTTGTLMAGAFVPELDDLVRLPAPAPVQPDGARAAADILAGILLGQGAGPSRLRGDGRPGVSGPGFPPDS